MSTSILQAELVTPVDWQALSADLHLATAAASALRVLHTAATLGEKPPVVSEDAAGLELEVARLHQKTQLLIELVAVALGRNAQRPAAQSVSLSGESCGWISPVPLNVGDKGLLVIWLHDALPEPLQWPAEVIESDMHSGAVRARLLPLGEAAQAGLERQVFLLHRRAIAEAKANRG